ncbi:Transcription initiation factor TFIIE alpha subunit [Monocercomonoides exilis]|uniref:Transcription initiation factor TFIIE alpha subunit n=1 Tax=Monocercomonoides exilis TaxID=2049356 RepID=UPI0035598F31|nr:Transcription initiation factor TFIIE alpha subunit [Monocercomonoides exilis]|eukprot:MONOS_6204.1-p1 / transcript=MONOS_6204.1 / gene=MONOS_6204 / organism=Monocercomonoides_exilis_PA203 / gene_product=Transcription initiation factor TFIIE alpha subunit / transcript_product=Transcription initiation factor TFIIE alpha subunit / location=Mono_scaffold00192:64064-64869(+) / protein_length=250 / sequence_SO=supercontig / SO=protein_coding / is_pseudo=false
MEQQPDPRVTHLVRTVMRAFYDSEYVVVMEALLRSNRIREERLVDMLHFSPKQTSRILNQLRSDQLIRCEENVAERGTGLGTGNIYWIDYRLFIDSVKYHITAMRLSLSADKKDNTCVYPYYCPKCRRKYDALAAQRHVDIETKDFLCCFCNVELNEVEASEPSITSPSSTPSPTPTPSPLTTSSVSPPSGSDGSTSSSPTNPLQRLNEALAPISRLLIEIDELAKAAKELEQEGEDQMPYDPFAPPTK